VDFRAPVTRREDLDREIGGSFKEEVYHIIRWNPRRTDECDIGRSHRIGVSMEHKPDVSTDDKPELMLLNVVE